MARTAIPENLIRLHRGEEELREKAIALIEADHRLSLHFAVIETTMDLLDTLRQYPTEDENLKVVQMLGMRMFNAFAAALKLALTGYSQNAALIMRDILETVFLLDLFGSDREAIAHWRTADPKVRRRKFSPVKVREALDGRDGFTSRKRAATYDLFSGLAGHPTMEGVAMLRPKGMDARNGPFIDATALEAVMSEAGKLAIQAGQNTLPFLPPDWLPAVAVRAEVNGRNAEWMQTFYPRPPEA